MSTAVILARPVVTTRTWQRWPGEDDTAFAAFEKYLRQVPPRRIMGVIGFTTTNLHAWSLTFGWPIRAREYDEHLSAIYETEKEEAIRLHARDTAAKHAQILGAARAIIMRQLDKYLDLDQDGDHPVYKPSDLSKLIELTLKYDRLTAGQSTENIATKHQDLSSLSEEELLQLRAIRLKIGE